MTQHLVTLGIIGGGVMGEALLSRILKNQTFPPQQVLVSAPQAARREQLQKTYDIQVTADNGTVIAKAEIVLLAIKPQVFNSVAKALPRPKKPSSQLILSILAGTPLKRLEAAFPGQPIVRAMPNTPATVGLGMTAIAPGQHSSAEHMQQASTIFEAVGEVVEVPEYQMDAVTGLSGSGPGYIAVMIEALTDGGVAAGLPRAIASKLALQTVRGTAELLYQTGMHPAELKDRVTSPGGTTIAGISRLEESAVRSALIEAVRASYRRSQELGQS
ncbi:MAG: pyrroline-5-carboxylate reductase [Elainellaceae cyanobacterium]